MRKNLLILPFLFLTVLILSQTNTYTPSSKTGQTVSKKSIKIYPNPAFNFIGISELSNVSNIIIYNLVGRKMKMFAAQKGEKYNVSDLPKGMYLVQLLTTNGKVLTTKRLSKK